jgi:hypothetical protein
MTSFATTLAKSLRVGLGAAALGLGFSAMVPTAAEAQNWVSPKNRGWGGSGGYAAPGFAPRAYGHRGYGHRGYVRNNRRGNGAAVAAGIIGGIAAGALIAGATRPAYAAPSYSYGQGGPVYVEDQGYGQHCYWRRVRQQVDYDTVVIRRVRVCE